MDSIKFTYWRVAAVLNVILISKSNIINVQQFQIKFLLFLFCYCIIDYYNIYLLVCDTDTVVKCKLNECYWIPLPFVIFVYIYTTVVNFCIKKTILNAIKLRFTILRLCVGVYYMFIFVIYFLKSPKTNFCSRNNFLSKNNLSPYVLEYSIAYLIYTKELVQFNY